MQLMLGSPLWNVGEPNFIYFFICMCMGKVCMEGGSQ